MKFAVMKMPDPMIVPITKEVAPTREEGGGAKPYNRKTNTHENNFFRQCEMSYLRFFVAK